MQTEDETMLTEMQRMAKYRASLRAKHMAQLELNKKSLWRLKAMAEKNGNVAADKPIPADSVMVAAAAASTEAEIRSHPIVTEYLKCYALINAFKKLIAQSLPTNSPNEALRDRIESFVRLEPLELESGQAVTPQLAQMSAHVRQVLDDTRLLFMMMLDESFAGKYDLLERDWQIIHLKSVTPRPLSKGYKAVLSATTQELNQLKNEYAEARLLGESRENTSMRFALSLIHFCLSTFYFSFVYFVCVCVCVCVRRAVASSWPRDDLETKLNILTEKYEQLEAKYKLDCDKYKHQIK